MISLRYMFNNLDVINFQVSIIMNIFNRFKPILDSSAGWGDRLVASIIFTKIIQLFHIQGSPSNV